MGMKTIIHSLFLVSILGCSSSVSQEMKIAPPADFNGYWYAGEAEITSYELEQARYGEIHKGTSVLVFVTEPFSKRKQVKLDNWRDQSEDNVSVLKLNMTKKFLTGIYPYSMMMSTFKPVSTNIHPKTFKVTTSSQEWCGHTFMQANLDQGKYRLRGYSYFESEGDVDEMVKEVVLEDELWTTIRLGPELLPTGSVELLPATFYLRLRHNEIKPKNAKLTLTSVSNSDFSERPHWEYEISYADRQLTVYFEEAFPYGILGWQETYASGFGNSGRLTTKAKRINTIKSPYWGKNSNADRKIRKELGLSVE